MEATVETISNLERRMTVVVPMKPIEEEVSQRIASLARTVKLAGFRPGKVPLKLVQQQTRHLQHQKPELQNLPAEPLARMHKHHN